MRMKKMKYEMPSMKVVVLKKRSQLLSGSYKAKSGFGGYYSAGSYDGYQLEDGDDL